MLLNHRSGWVVGPCTIKTSPLQFLLFLFHVNIFSVLETLFELFRSVNEPAQEYLKVKVCFFLPEVKENVGGEELEVDLMNTDEHWGNEGGK